MMRKSGASGMTLNTRCQGKTLYEYPEGVEFKVVDVKKMINMSHSCWRISIEIQGAQKINIVDIPTCGIHHPRPSWITSATPGVFPLEIKEEFAITKTLGSP